MEKFFKLKENKTTVSTEVMAGVTTFFAMSYILFVNPTILSAAGMPFQAVFLATIVWISRPKFQVQGNLHWSRMKH